MSVVSRGIVMRKKRKVDIMSEPTPVATPATETPVPAYSAGWLAKVGPFAAACGVSIEDATTKLKGLVGDPTDESAALLGNAEYTSDSDLIAAMTGIPTARARKGIAGLRDAPAPAPVAAFPVPIAHTGS